MGDMLVSDMGEMGGGSEEGGMGVTGKLVYWQAGKRDRRNSQFN